MDTPTENDTPKVPSSGTNVESQWKKVNVSTIDDFRELEQGSQIEVQRLSPNQIKGYCGHLVIPDGGISDVLEEIAQTYGGGRYQLRGKHLSDNGRLNYVAGSVQVDVAGYPRSSGKEYINGMWHKIALPVAVAATVLNPSAGPNSGSAGMEGLMTTFLTQALSGALSGDGGIKLEAMPALITAIAGLHKPSQERDSFSDLERTLSLVDKLEKRRSEPDPAPAPAADSDGMAGILQMLAAKFLAPQPQPPPGNYARPPLLPPPIYQNAPGNAPASGQQMWEQMHQPGSSVPGPDWTPGQQPIQPNYSGPPSGPPAQPVPPTPSPPVQTPAADEGEQYEPLTTDEIMNDLAARTEPDRLAFLEELCGKLGISEGLARQMFPQPAAGDPTPTGATLPAPPSSAPRLDTTYERTEE